MNSHDSPSMYQNCIFRDQNEYYPFIISLKLSLFFNLNFPNHRYFYILLACKQIFILLFLLQFCLT